MKVKLWLKSPQGNWWVENIWSQFKSWRHFYSAISGSKPQCKSINRWNVTKYIYFRRVLKYNFKALLIYLSVFKVCYLYLFTSVLRLQFLHSYTEHTLNINITRCSGVNVGTMGADTWVLIHLLISILPGFTFSHAVAGLSIYYFGKCA